MKLLLLRLKREKPHLTSYLAEWQQKLCLMCVMFMPVVFHVFKSTKTDTNWSLGFKISPMCEIADFSKGNVNSHQNN